MPAKYEDFLYEAMIEAYKKVIGEDYSPIIRKVEKKRGDKKAFDSRASKLEEV